MQNEKTILDFIYDYLRVVKVGKHEAPRYFIPAYAVRSQPTGTSRIEFGGKLLGYMLTSFELYWDVLEFEHLINW